MYKGKKPLRVCIPVNLKKYYPSKTISNFFSFIMLDGKRKQEEFEEIITLVKTILIFLMSGILLMKKLIFQK